MQAYVGSPVPVETGTEAPEIALLLAGEVGRLEVAVVEAQVPLNLRVRIQVPVQAECDGLLDAAVDAAAGQIEIVVADADFPGTRAPHGAAAPAAEEPEI